MDKDEQITRMAQPSKEFSGFQEARRTWVGLTDEQKYQLCNSNYNRDSELVEMVEAKLKEKNGFTEEKNT